MNNASEAIHESLIQSDRLRLMCAARKAISAYEDMSKVQSKVGKALVDLREAIRCAEATDKRYE